MKKWIKYALVFTSAVIIIAGSYVFVKTSYHGNNKILFLNSGKAYTSFNDIIQRSEFKNKTVYVDIWGTTCPPCFEELKNYTPQLTQHYKNTKDIAFLYICIDRHPFSEVRWKDKVQMLKPPGYHVLVEAEEEPKLAKDILGQAVDGQYFPYEPFYFIVSKQGHIIGKLSADPDKGELKPSDKNALYNKLDSLRQL